MAYWSPSAKPDDIYQVDALGDRRRIKAWLRGCRQLHVPRRVEILQLEYSERSAR
jgi:hypothetical protein